LDQGSRRTGRILTVSSGVFSSLSSSLSSAATFSVRIGKPWPGGRIAWMVPCLSRKRTAETRAVTNQGQPSPWWRHGGGSHDHGQHGLTPGARRHCAKLRHRNRGRRLGAGSGCAGPGFFGNAVLHLASVRFSRYRGKRQFRHCLAGLSGCDGGPGQHGTQPAGVRHLLHGAMGYGHRDQPLPGSSRKLLRKATPLPSA